MRYIHLIPIASFSAAQITIPPIKVPPLGFLFPGVNIPAINLPNWLEMTGGYDSPSSIINMAKKSSGPDLRTIGDIFKVPNIVKYVDHYLDWRNVSKVPFFHPNPFGPAPTDCAKNEVIVARAIGELGEYGFVVGDPMVAELKKEMPNIQAFAVQYPAYWGADSTPAGINSIVERLTKHAAACPETKFALLAFSQGAALMRQALQDPAIGNATSRIVGGAFFGDPGLGLFWSLNLGLKPLPEIPRKLNMNIKQICQKNDPACTTGSNALDHITYSSTEKTHIQDAAKHIISLFRRENGP